MNKCIYVGNLTKDFDVKYTPEGLAIARGAIALNRGKDKDGNDKGADFPSLVAFGKTAEVMEKYGKKGKKFAFECHVQTGSYEKDGQKHYTTDFVIDRFDFCESKGESSPFGMPVETNDDEFMNIPDGIAEELPFA